MTENDVCGNQEEEEEEGEEVCVCVCVWGDASVPMKHVCVLLKEGEEGRMKR